MSGLVKGLAAVLPPTIHPMIVHFPIALLYLTIAVDILMWVAPPEQGRFFPRASFWLLTASCVAIIAAMVAGIISEQSIHLTPQTQAMLSAHQHYAILTGLCAGAAWLLRVFGRFPRAERGGWSIFGTGRGRPSLLATVFVAGAVIFVSITGSLGGSMVYDHGVGVHASAPTSTTTSSTAKTHG